jgi:hypothetical protein
MAQTDRGSHVQEWAQLLGASVPESVADDGRPDRGAFAPERPDHDG